MLLPIDPHNSKEHALKLLNNGMCKYLKDR